MGYAATKGSAAVSMAGEAWTAALPALQTLSRVKCVRAMAPAGLIRASVSVTPVEPDAVICSGHGVCGANGCECVEGWYGAGCHEGCPGAPHNICSGHGTCGGTSGTCQCDAAYVKLWGTGGRWGGRSYGSVWLGELCDGMWSDVVWYVGFVSPYAPHASRWWGSACESECPGTLGDEPCNGHGECSATT